MAATTKKAGTKTARKPPAKATKDTAKKETAPAKRKRAGGKTVNTKWHKKFITALEQCPNIEWAARVTKISKKTAYTHMKRYPRFAASVEDAKETAVAVLEAVAWNRAVKGELEPVFHAGKQVATVAKKDTKALFRILAAYNPRYRTKLELAGKDGQPIDMRHTGKLDLKIQERNVNVKLLAKAARRWADSVESGEANVDIRDVDAS